MKHKKGYVLLSTSIMMFTVIFLLTMCITYIRNQVSWNKFSLVNLKTVSDNDNYILLIKKEIIIIRDRNISLADMGTDLNSNLTSLVSTSESISDISCIVNTLNSTVTITYKVSEGTGLYLRSFNHNVILNYSLTDDPIILDYN